MRPGPPTGQVRGCLVGAAVGALAVAAHGTAGGGLPNSAELTLLLLIAAAAGGVAGLRPASRGSVFGLLALGQFGGHVALSGMLGHESHSSPLSTGPMLFAHIVATFCCAALILVVDRLYAVVSQAIRVALGVPRRSRVADRRRWADPGVPHYRFHPNGAIGPRAPPVSV
ncbi:MULTISPECIES: hypothetical protein [unclassified Nocardia]|uniref:hypothetical protein n=1 Tax=unclassified Nocardia TaxID=2637762 RepID=UPI001CE4B0A2|nr:MULTISPECIES: hypothetical protein [unclassified Nocardia]